MAEMLLRAAGLTKRFGGLLANDDIDFAVAPDEIHALIGPNGAGKTTFLALIAGELAPDAGEIFLGGANITPLRPAARALAGIGRAFQITSILGSFSVLENVAIAAQAHDGHSFRFWQKAHRDRALNEQALAALGQVGLDHRAGAIAANLSHGEHRLLEVAIAIAGDPKLLLMDEPTSGMGPQESQKMVALFQHLRGRYGILLIEHDMDVVFAVADRVTVLANGRVIASGTPQAIAADEAVRAAYLGDPAAATGRRHA
jgi:branched-chain amino acid transport system ATP-binding protein